VGHRGLPSKGGVVREQCSTTSEGAGARALKGPLSRGDEVPEWAVNLRLIAHSVCGERKRRLPRLRGPYGPPLGATLKALIMLDYRRALILGLEGLAVGCDEGFHLIAHR
jgi:hypothetical protein